MQCRVLVAEPRTVDGNAPSVHTQPLVWGRSIVTGVRAASQQSKYMLCLDDDVILHPSALQTLVNKLESDPSAFMATGAGGPLLLDHNFSG